MKKKKNRKKLTVFVFLIFVISLYFYIGINITVETEGSENIKNPQKILLALYFGEESEVLCASPLKNVCFYPNVYYEVNKVNGKLYTYFEKEYREVVKYEEGYFIKEDKYLENMKNKVGEIKNGRVRFNKAVYKKEECKTKKESIVETVKLIFSKSERINVENKISLFLSKGCFTEFTSLRDINKEEITDMIFCIEDADLYTEVSFISDIVNLSENNKEDTSLIILNAGENSQAFTNENTRGFKQAFVINFLSPYEIEGKRTEGDTAKEENFESYNMFCEEIDFTVDCILDDINKNALITESISDKEYSLSSE